MLSTRNQSSSETTPVDLVIVIDTSASMKNEALALSKSTEAAINKVSLSCQCDLRVEWLGIEGTWEGTNFNQTVRNYLRDNCGVADSDIRGRKRGTLSKAGAQEDGARAIEDISTHFNWRVCAYRGIFYLSDEALEGGGDTEQEDIEAANRAIEKAKAAEVIVHTYFGTSTSKYFGTSTSRRDKTQAEFARLAKETGGQTFISKDAIGGFAEILKTVICATRNRDNFALVPVVPVYFVQAQHLVDFSANTSRDRTTTTTTQTQTESQPVDLVVVIDSSTSMKDEAEALSQAAEAAINLAISSSSCDLRVEWFGIEGTFSNTKFTKTLRKYLIEQCGVGESSIRGRKRGTVAGGGAQEDGARAVEDISTHFNWRGGAARAIFYLSDEALEGGDDTDQEDIVAANRAIEVAKGAGVIVHTYFGTSSSKGRDKTKAEFARLAQETGGQAFTNQDALAGFASILTKVISTTTDQTVREPTVTATEQYIPVIPLQLAAVAGGTILSQTTTAQLSLPTASLLTKGTLMSVTVPNTVAVAGQMPIYMMATKQIPLAPDPSD